MTRYLFIPQPSDSHIAASLPIATELLSRGDQVSYLVPRQYTQHIADADVYGYHLPDRYPPKAALHAQTPSLLLLYIHELRQALAVLPQAVGTVSPDQVDFVVYDGMCLWARMFAQLIQRRSVCLRTSFAATTEHNPYHEARGAGATTHRLNATLEELGRLRDTVRTQYGMRAPSAWSIFTHSGELNLVLVPESFHPLVPHSRNSYVFTGPSFVGDPERFPDNSESGLEVAAAADHRPLVYISLGTSELNDNVEMYRQCFRAFANQPIRVLMSYGRNVDPHRIGAVPANFHLAAWVPQIAALRHADAFVSHCGMASVMESMYFGVPIVAVPMMREQTLIAHLVEKHRAGIQLNAATMTSSDLATATAALLAGQQCAGLEACRRTVRSSGGYRAAADAINQFALGSPLARPASWTSPGRTER